MSKKKAKPPKKPAKRMKSARSRSDGTGRSVGPSKRKATATIFLYDIGGVPQVRTSPQRLGAGPGFLEWTVVNLTSRSPVDVDITWRDTDPWGGKTPIKIKDGNIRINLNGAKDGLYKYNVSANSATEDPEIEIPES
jgi:hypothetical protein